MSTTHGTHDTEAITPTHQGAGLETLVQIAWRTKGTTIQKPGIDLSVPSYIRNMKDQSTSTYEHRTPCRVDLPFSKDPVSSRLRGRMGDMAQFSMG